MKATRIYGLNTGRIGQTVRPQPFRKFLQQHQTSNLSTITHWIPPDSLSDENDIDHFRQQYFAAEKPVVLRSAGFVRQDLPGYQKWFVEQKEKEDGVRLNYEYLSQFGHALVPLEMTTTTTTSESSPDGAQMQFQRLNAPLSMFLNWTQFTQERQPPAAAENKNKTTIYLAQCHIFDLPPTLSSDFLPAPRLVTETGKNDVYATNLWIGSPPTYTPLHKDPNPNLFVQLAGLKRVRILGPGDGMGVFMHVRNQIASSNGGGGGGASIRGEEMMMGAERGVLEDVVWGNHSETASDKSIVGYDVLLERGDVLFIPKGWWHSLKGVGKGITASVCFFFLFSVLMNAM